MLVMADDKGKEVRVAEADVDERVRRSSRRCRPRSRNRCRRRTSPI